jgi:hypothetical protein
MARAAPRDVKPLVVTTYINEMVVANTMPNSKNKYLGKFHKLNGFPLAILCGGRYNTYIRNTKPKQGEAMNYDKKYCRASQVPMLVGVDDQLVDLAKELLRTRLLTHIGVIKAVRVIAGDLLIAKKATDIAKVEVDSAEQW